jgi:hypothetical protein
MQSVLFDTSIYITALRIGDNGALGLKRIAGGSPVRLSSVVPEELYAGVSERNSVLSATSAKQDGSWFLISRTGRRRAKCSLSLRLSTTSRKSGGGG